MTDDDEIEAPASMDPETTCSICYAEFLDAEDLVMHVQQVHWTDSCRNCDFCPSIYRCLDDYSLHIRDNHLLTLKVCKHCKRVYNDYDKLRKHEKLHSNQQRGKILFCSHCAKTFDNAQDLADHEFKCHNDGRDGVFLNEIFPLLSAQLNINAFNFLMSLRETAAYICPCCIFTVNDPTEYINHIKKKKCLAVVCSKCCNVYRDKKGIIKHLHGHKECLLDSKEEDLMKKCKKCEKNISINSYKEHLKSCKPIKCNVCDIVMDTMYALSQHQSEHHPMTIQMKTCQFCHREFVGSVALQRHFNRKHSKDIHLYKYKCVHCEDMYFKHPQNLFGHLFSKHHDIEPYCCKICNKKFRLRKKFTIHIKLEHNSVGFVEFDENYNVYFTANKSDNPFTPTCLFPELIPDKSQVDQTDNEHDTDAPTDIQTDAQTDAPTDCPTDAQTDAEESKPKAQRKPPKIRYKEEKSKRNQAAQLQSDTNMSEAQTDKENGNLLKEMKSKRTRGRKLRERTIKKQVFHEDKIETDSEDEPLVKIKRKSMADSKWKSKANMSKKDRLTCNICKKYCYTLLNYNYHMSLHFKNEVKKCVKCSEEFSSKTDLQEHMAEKHSSSRLTETLKNLLERRKQSQNGTLPELTTSEKFKKTIKRVKNSSPQACATIKEVKEDLSVKKFIEEFTPDEINKDPNSKATKEKTNIEIQSNVNVTSVNYRKIKPPAIKMVKFKPQPPPPAVAKLALPVRFKEVATEKPHITCKVVHQSEAPNYEEETAYFDQGDDNVNTYEEYEEHSQEPKLIVPEMAEEVLLETQEPPSKPVSIPHQIIIPEIPQALKNEIQIAHLLPEAPYFKIVKMTDVIKATQDTSEVEKEKELEEDVQLPPGTKLVNVNPLAHLLGNTTVEQIFGPKPIPKKPRKPVKTPDFQKAIAKALAKLEKADAQPKRKRIAKKKDQDNNESIVSEQ